MDAGAGLKTAGSRDDPSGAPDCANRMVARHGPSVIIGENSQDAVADKLVHVTAIRHDEGNHRGQVFIQQLHYYFRSLLLGCLFSERCETADVGEHDRDRLAFPGQLDGLRFVKSACQLLSDEQRYRGMKEIPTPFCGGKPVDDRRDRTQCHRDQQLRRGYDHTGPACGQTHHHAGRDRGSQ